MLRKVVSGIVLMLLLTSTLSSASVIQPVKAEWTGTVYIRADGSIDPPDAPIQREGDVYTLTDNITSLGDGIVVERSNIIIDGNGYTLQGNKSGDGVCLSSVSNVTIKNTNIKDFYSTKPFVFYYGIYLHESSNNRIFENNLVNNDVGIYLDFSSNNELFRNKILESNLYGIESYRSSNNHIFGNNVTKSWIAGIRLESSLNNEVFGNNIAHNDEDGIELKSADNNSVFENNITANNCYGISIWLSSNNSVFRNDITSNSKEMGGTGINLDGSSYNRLYQNNIANNDWGIYFYYSLYNRVFRNNITTNYHGVYFDSSSLNNSVYHNNFVSNPAHSECVNVWDNGYPFGGNYWSDYTGVDLFSGSYQNLTGSDGIGDTSYVIDENNTDRYPLMGPFSSFNTSVGYFVDVISNSTVEDFRYFESNSTIVMYVSNMTAGQAFGFCRLTIPHEVMSPPYTVKVNGTTIEHQTVYENHTEGISIIYFTYEHSKLEITIIPEFPSTTMLTLLMLTTLIATILLKKKRKTKPQLP